MSEITSWWKMLREQTDRHLQGRIPLAFLDANAKFVYQVGEEQPLDANAEALQSFARDLELARTASHQHGKPVHTWTAPNGAKNCIDYLLWPRAWASCLQAQHTTWVDDAHADYDHRLLHIRLHMTLEGSIPKQPWRLDIEAMHTPAGQAAIADIWRALPQMPWEMHIDDHVLAINTYLQGQLAHTFAKPADAPRSPTISGTTWALLHARRGCRRAQRYRRQALAKLTLYSFWVAWRQASRHGDNLRLNGQVTHFKLKGLRMQLALHARDMRHYAARIRDSHKADEAAFARYMFQEARAKGPHELARLIRAILRTGRKYKAPRAAPCIEVDGTPTSDPVLVAQAFGRHFAKAECATAQPLKELQQQQQHVPPTATEPVDLLEVPHLSCLAQAFATAANRRAPGLSGLPPDFYSAQPLAAARAHMPVILKMLSRGQAPTLWTGNLSICMPKPAKDHTSVDGYRAIAMVEVASKATTKALRPFLTKAVAALSLPGTGGTMPGAPMTLAAMTVQSHLQFLRKQKLCGAVIFVDGANAFYAVVRDYVLDSKADSFQQWLSHLPVPDRIRRRLQRRFSQGNLLEEAGLTQAQQDLVQQFLRRTWYTTHVDGRQIFSTQAGTAPGSPVADAIFQVIFASALRELHQDLTEIGATDCIEVSGAGCQAADMPTWMDDMAVLLTCPAEKLELQLSQATALVQAHLRAIGISVNFGRGKFEVLLAVHGKGSQALRQRLLIEQAARIQVGDTSQTIECVASYVHLGTLRQATGSDWDDLARRKYQTDGVFAKVRGRLLNNPHLSWQEKVHMLGSLIMRKFLHGAGTWVLRTKGELARYRAYYMAYVRGATWPLCGHSSKFLDDDAICALNGILRPDQALAIERARTLWQVANGRSAYLRASIVRAGIWLEKAAHDMDTILQALQLPRLPALPQDTSAAETWFATMQRDPADAANVLRRVAKLWLRAACEAAEPARRKVAALGQMQAARVTVLYLYHTQSGNHEALHACPDCGRTFEGPAALASHQSKVHHHRAECSLALFGSACEACGLQFWLQRRLREHLRHHAQCRATYLAADIAPQPEVNDPRLQHLPTTRRVGPQPFWASLRPPVPTNCPVGVAPATTAAFKDGLRSILDQGTLHSFANTWFGQVERNPELLESVTVQHCTQLQSLVVSLLHVRLLSVQGGEGYIYQQGCAATIACMGRYTIYGLPANVGQTSSHFWLQCLNG